MVPEPAVCGRQRCLFCYQALLWHSTLWPVMRSQTPGVNPLLLFCCMDSYLYTHRSAQLSDLIRKASVCSEQWLVKKGLIFLKPRDNSCDVTKVLLVDCFCEVYWEETPWMKSQTSCHRHVDDASRDSSTCVLRTHYVHDMCWENRTAGHFSSSVSLVRGGKCTIYYILLRPLWYVLTHGNKALAITNTASHLQIRHCPTVSA